MTPSNAYWRRTRCGQGGVLSGLKSPALALVCALFATTASASIQLDQSDIPESGAVPIFDIVGTALGGGEAGLGQTITAGLTGRLARIDLMLFASPYGTDQGGLTVSVEKAPGVTLATRHIDFSDLPRISFLSTDYGQIPQFDFASADIQVAAGETFSVVVTADAGSVWSDAGYFYFIGAYDGGAGFARTSLYGDLPYFGDLDQGFRTYVDVPGGAVPEPNLWATLILGFGAAGATLRRRRRATC